MSEPISLNEYLKEDRKIREDFHSKRRELEARLAIFQNQCKHEGATFHSDPSGGSDSFHYCSKCGKEI